jgi:hypothetical protein
MVLPNNGKAIAVPTNRQTSKIQECMKRTIPDANIGISDVRKTMLINNESLNIPIRRLRGVRPCSTAN